MTLSTTNRFRPGASSPRWVITPRMRIGVMISNTLGPCRFSEAVEAIEAVASAGLDTPRTWR